MIDSTSPSPSLPDQTREVVNHLNRAVLPCIYSFTAAASPAIRNLPPETFSAHDIAVSLATSLIPAFRAAISAEKFFPDLPPLNVHQNSPKAHPDDRKTPVDARIQLESVNVPVEPTAGVPSPVSVADPRVSVQHVVRAVTEEQKKKLSEEESSSAQEKKQMPAARAQDLAHVPSKPPRETREGIIDWLRTPSPGKPGNSSSSILKRGGDPPDSRTSDTGAGNGKKIRKRSIEIQTSRRGKENERRAWQCSGVKGMSVEYDSEGRPKKVMKLNNGRIFGNHVKKAEAEQGG